MFLWSAFYNLSCNSREKRTGNTCIAFQCLKIDEEKLDPTRNSRFANVHFCRRLRGKDNIASNMPTATNYSHVCIFLHFILFCVNFCSSSIFCTVSKACGSKFNESLTLDSCYERVLKWVSGMGCETWNEWGFIWRMADRFDSHSAQWPFLANDSTSAVKSEGFRSLESGSRPPANSTPFNPPPCETLSKALSCHT